MEQTPSNFFLKSSDIKILKDLFNTYSKDNMMKFYEFFLFCLDKELVSNKANFRTFIEAFNKVSEGEDRIDFNKFTNLLTVVAKFLIPSHKRPIMMLLNDYLGDKTVSVSDRIQKARTIHRDDTNKRLLHTEIMNVYLKYETLLQDAYTLYFQTNYPRKKMFLTWRELSLQNKKMGLHSFIKMLEDAQIVMALKKRTAVAELASKIAVPCTKRETEFYNDQEIKQPFVPSTDPNGHVIPEGDPGLYYHEFVLLLARIALEIPDYKSGGESRSNWDYHEIMEHFLLNTLGFGLVIKLTQPGGVKIDEESFDNKFVRKVADYQAIRDDDMNVDLIRPPTPEKVDDSLKREYEDLRSLLQEEPNMATVREAILNLNKKLPRMPSPPRIEQPPTGKKAKKLMKPDVFGDQVPKEKNMNRARPAPRPRRRNKDEKPTRWAGMPTIPSDSIGQKVAQYKNELMAEKKLFKLNTGTLSDIEIDPVIIKEVIYPENPPMQVIMYIEAAISGQSEGRFVFALRNLNQARDLWAGEDTEGNQVYKMTPSDQLFLEFMTASIYESACRDDLALFSYTKCFNHTEKLGMNPDQALPYLGLGGVMYHSGEYELAARCFHKAREYRESFIGGNEADTATTYNNYGCCLFKMNRIQEAFDYFKLAELIYAAELGPFHERTLVAKRNKNKSMKGDFKIEVPYHRSFQFYFNDKTSKVGVGGNRKKGKKRKGK